MIWTPDRANGTEDWSKSESPIPEHQVDVFDRMWQPICLQILWDLATDITFSKVKAAENS